ncbi:hypothetical protein J5U23_01868 [Saccharolobus shibatae B12]|uniref:Uncharacterized protein n=1 Tax=Saccharolobus shibatae (strain ATCC 51178 / DSM 5389 / JCM 8931 / NBRC 15437 / B12) TaxID=523848 RepID=A0A8F5BPB6_SACSH|nr:hypothetical protein J5U23_01868 [Saccharolobus shibatae B12]
MLSRIKPTKGTSWGLVQAVLYLLGRKSVFLDVISITVKKIVEDFKKVMEVLKEELDEAGLKLVMVFDDRDFVNDVVRILLDMGLDFVIAAKAQMYREYERRLNSVDVKYGGVRYVGFLGVKHKSGAYLIILKKEDDSVLAFLVMGERDVYGAIVLAEMYRERWGVENAFLGGVSG